MSHTKPTIAIVLRNAHGVEVPQNNCPISDRSLRVLMMPDYRQDNPYQTLLAQALQNEGVDVTFPQGYRRVFPLFRAVRTSGSVDVLHLHWVNPYLKGQTWWMKGIYSLKCLIDLLWVRGSGVRVVWTIHNRLSHETPFPRLERWANRQIARLADQIIVHQTSALPWVTQLGISPQKTTVIPHGHYRDTYGPAIDPRVARQHLGLPLTGRIYLHLGLLRPYKGLERLFQVWQDSQDILAQATLLVVGQPLDDAYRTHLMQQAETIPGVVFSPGFVHASQISVFFSAADLVVLPFQEILTSGSLILAMSYHKPVIAPRLPGIVETLGEADALLYDPQDEQGLRQALQRSQQIDLQGLSQRVKQGCDRLQWAPIAQQTKQVYDCK